MDKAGALLKELKEVAKDVGVLEKSTKLSSLIKQVRACKTAAEERALIAKESAAMRAEFREQARCRCAHVVGLTRTRRGEAPA
jgi:hypothetical protein